MARRASSSIHPGIIIGAIAAIVVAVVAGKSLLGKKSTASIDGEKLNVHELLENGNSLRGNEYVIEGQIDEKLQWTTGNGQLVSVKVNADGDDDYVAIVIPQQFNNLNIATKQKYAFRVKFRQGGIPVATAVTNL